MSFCLCVTAVLVGWLAIVELFLDGGAWLGSRNAVPRFLQLSIVRERKWLATPDMLRSPIPSFSDNNQLTHNTSPLKPLEGPDRPALTVLHLHLLPATGIHLMQHNQLSQQCRGFCGPSPRLQPKHTDHGDPIQQATPQWGGPAIHYDARHGELCWQMLARKRRSVK